MKSFGCFWPSSRRRPYCILERRLSLGDIQNTLSRSQYFLTCDKEITIEGEEWCADMSQLFIGSKFAAGRYSRVYHGIYKKREVAVKMISQPEDDEALACALEQQFTSEVALLLRLRHPNIIRLVAACNKPSVLCIMTEYMEEGSLRRYLHNKFPQSLPLKLVLKLSLEIARAMDYLHSHGILHRDLKSENILLGKDLSVKVADFGISCKESNCGSGKGFTSTYRWMAPEMIKGKHHTRKVDVYSFGIVLWELLTALIPFHDMNPEQAAFAVAEKNIRPPLPPSCPMGFRYLIKQCWDTNPDKRPNFNQIVSILEMYKESLEKDSSFFMFYKPKPWNSARWWFSSPISFFQPSFRKA